MSAWRAVCFLAALPCAVAAWGLPNQVSSKPPSRGNSTTPLCELLESISPGERRPATVRGILVLGFETNMLYDPDSPWCPLDVQPTTEVELSYKIPGTRRLAETAKLSDGRAYVTLRGVLWGPGEVKEDDFSLPLVVSYSRRAPERYGHMSYSRTKFVIDDVLESEPVPAAVASLGEASRPVPETHLPVLLEAAVPMYPAFARNAQITGEVIVEVTIKGGRATSTTVKAGDRALAQAVLKNIETWRFDEKVEATFTTTFEFVLELHKTGDDRNSRLELNLPSSARIVAAANAW
jgi:TonB family protein